VSLTPLIKSSMANPHPGQRVQPNQRLHVCLITVDIDYLLTPPSAEIPSDAVSTLESNDKITVEADGEVKTQ
jgi:hypothetical protein